MINRETIKKYYEVNGLSPIRICRTRLKDGWFIYHNAAMAHRGYDLPTIISQTGSRKTYKINRKEIRSDFIGDDDFENMIEMQIGEGRIRMGLSCRDKIKWNDFLIERG